MSRHWLFTRPALRTWLFANGLVVATLVGWLLNPGGPGGDLTEASRQTSKTRVLDMPGQRFGLSAPRIPWSRPQVNRLARAAGARPTMLQYFVNWTDGFKTEAVKRSYQQGALPMLSWEPWAGTQGGASQPGYALSKIIKGDFDRYVTRFARNVRDQRRVIAIRFAHEMNGHWYPWSEAQSGNRKGEYVRAWRHVHNIFTRAGVKNVIWIWSPNILRPVPEVSLSDLYPGDAYVDWVGMVGYAKTESTAGPVFDPTLAALREFTRKPVVITETGAPYGPRKAGWIKDFFTWLGEHPEVVGFIWFEFSAKNGGAKDWRFTDTPASRAAFRAGLDRIPLARSP